jgi:neutral trehalase
MNYSNAGAVALSVAVCTKSNPNFGRDMNHRMGVEENLVQKLTREKICKRKQYNKMTSKKSTVVEARHHKKRIKLYANGSSSDKENRYKSEKDLPDDNGRATTRSVAKKNKPKGKPKCSRCFKPGHSKAKCGFAPLTEQLKLKIPLSIWD